MISPLLTDNIRDAQLSAPIASPELPRFFIEPGGKSFQSVKNMVKCSSEMSKQAASPEAFQGGRLLQTRREQDSAMIKTRCKPETEILNALPAGAVVGIIGCGDCAAVLGTGGTKQVEAWSALLHSRNPVAFAAVIESPCDQRTFKRFFRLLPRHTEVEFVLLLACPAGGQSVSTFLRAELPAALVILGLTAQGPGWITHTGDSGWHDCRLCTTCEHDFSGDVCPLTACPLLKHDGPCQNRGSDDSCPHHEALTCVWVSKKL
jgi:hypothetical protein